MGKNNGDPHHFFYQENGDPGKYLDPNGSNVVDQEIRERIFSNQILQPRNETHHIVPETRATAEIKNIKENKTLINKKLHRRYHSLLLNRIPEEVLDLLVNYFWGGNILFVEDFYSKNSNGDNRNGRNVNGGSRIKLWRHEYYQFWFKKQIESPMDNVHYIVPLSRGGTEDEENITKVNVRMRNAYQIGLFLDRTPEEVLDMLVNYFWKGRMCFVKNYLFLMSSFKGLNYKFLYPRDAFRM